MQLSSVDSPLMLNNNAVTSSPLMQSIKDNALSTYGATSANFSLSPKPILDSVNQVQINASEKVNAVETKQSDDVIGAVVAAQKASLSFNALMQVRNKMVTGINDILKMPL